MRNQPPLVLEKGRHLTNAREIRRRSFVTTEGESTLVFHKGEFFRWDGVAYAKLDGEGFRALMWQNLGKGVTPSRQGLVPFEPSRHVVSNTIEAMKAEVLLDSCFAPPAWLSDPHPDCDPLEILACQNGLVNLRTRDLMPASPNFFCVDRLDFSFNKNVVAAPRWSSFVQELWPDDPQSILTLQEILGYCLTSDTSHQKIFLLVGPRRGGKGTLERVIQRLVGLSSVCAPTLSSLTGAFGLEPLIGKKLAIIADARLGGRTDQHAVAERLLSISGEDLQNANRKFRSFWAGKLPTRFIILTNETPRIADSSGALSRRMIALQLRESFEGREDLRLTERLLTELPGIFTWALDGLDRLRDQGHFTQPASASSVLDDLGELSSPITSFVEDCCDLEAEHQVACTDLYYQWKWWSELHGWTRITTLQTFSRDLHSAFPQVTTIRPRKENTPQRIRYFKGIKLKPPSERWSPGPRSF